MTVDPVRMKVLITNGHSNHRHSMMCRRVAVGIPALVAAIAVTAVVVAAAIFAVAPFSTTVTKTMDQLATTTQTITGASTMATASTQTPQCSAITFAGIETPIPTEPWFTAGVNYSGQWEAVVTIYNNGSPMFSACYTGNNTGGDVAQFFYQNSSLTSTATISITATKLDGSTAILHVACNGNVDSTSLPYGSATLSAPVDNAGTG